METPENVKCPLCGNEFVFDGRGCSGACPLGQHCNLVCCPNCHYSFPRDSRTVNLFKKIWRKKKDDEPET